MPFGRRRNRIDRSLRERGVPPEPQHREREVEETTGPWDVADAPDDGIARLDLGSLRLPACPGMELRVDLNQQQKVVGATLRSGDSLLQVAAFAAPRAAGIWDDVRADIATTASGQGALAARGRGTLRHGAGGHRRRGAPGPGRAARARTQPAARPASSASTGRAGSCAASSAVPRRRTPEAAAELEEAFRAIVVVRGTEPMPVREQLPLTLPAEAAAQVAAQQQEAAARPAGAAAPGTPPAGGSTGGSPAPGSTTLGP